jgi:GNAT superfamily N-acetyltransferase
MTTSRTSQAPATAGATEGKKAAIRSAGQADAAAACSVLRRSISECCTEDHRNDAAILAAWLGNKTPATVETWFLSSSNYSLVATFEGDMVGVGMLTRAGKIVLCYVTPEVRFTGIGKDLLLALEAQAREWGIRTVQVASTTTARSFYLRNGYLPGATSRSAFGIEALSFTKNIGGSYPRKGPCGCG